MANLRITEPGTSTCLFVILLNCVGNFIPMTLYFLWYLNLRILTLPTQSDNHMYRKSVVYLVCYEGGDPVFSSTGVDENVVLSPQCFGPCPGCDGLLDGLVQKLGPWVHTERLRGWLSAFTVDIYLEWTSLTECQVEKFIQLVSRIEVRYSTLKA